MKSCLEVIFTGRELEATRLWSLIAEQSLAHGDLVLYGQRVDPEDLPRRLIAKGNEGFAIESNGQVWDFATVAVWGHQMLRLSADECQLPDQRLVARSLFSRIPSFVQAYYFDYEYYFWQNASDLIQFRGSGLDITKLSLVDNGLPPPLSKLVVDTSANPLRRVLRKGYVEMVAPQMWLSSNFFRVSGHDLDETALGVDEFEVVKVGDLVEVKYLQGDFNSVDTADAQNALRHAVYGV